MHIYRDSLPGEFRGRSFDERENAMKTTRNGRKSVAAIVAVVALIATALGGTYAYTDYKQHKSNELSGEYGKYEARLVEDFIEIPDWKVDDGAITKKISVVNRGRSVEGFGDVYARIQLKEFMEIAPLAYTETEKRYMIDTEGRFIYYGTEAQAQLAVGANGPYPGHTYAQLTDSVTGITGFFIETKDHDPNGQMGKHMVTNITVGTAEKVITSGPGRATDTNHHGTVTTDGQGNSVLVRDSEECLYAIHTWDGVDLETRQYIEWGLNTGAIITVTEWFAAGAPPVAKWILEDRDDTGWVYWGQALPPDGGTTEDFMKDVTLILQPEGSFYYVVHTELEAVSYDELDEWGDVGERMKNNSPWIRFNGPTPTQVVVGQTVASPSVTVGPAGAAQSPLTWSSSNDSIATVDANGVVTGVRVGGPVTIRVTAPNGARTQYSLTVVPGEPTIIPATGISITADDMTVLVGQTLPIAYTLTPADTTEKPTWTSSNNALATVDADGKVTGVAPGVVTVTGNILAGGANGSDTIQVFVIKPASNINFNASSMTIEVGQTLPIEYSLVPNDSNEKPTWTSNNTSYATVDSEGNVTGVSVGTATITGKIANGQQKTITVTVVPALVPATGFSINADDMTVYVGQTLPIAYTLTPAGSNEKPTWTSSNASIASVNANGEVTGVGPGTVTVTGRIAATGPGTTDTITVKVIKKATGISASNLTVQVGQTLPISYSLTPSDSNEKPSWTSGNTAAATVDADGNVTGVAVGSATVTGTVIDGASTTITVTVVAQEIDADTITISAQNLTVAVGATQQIAYVLTPANATEKPTWTSANAATATVDANGVVRGVAVGTTTVTGKLKNNQSATINVTVVQPATGFSITANDMTVEVGQTLPIQFTITPSNTTEKPAWSSANTARATVDEDGYVTGVSVGDVVITGSIAAGASDTITVHVVPEQIPATNITIAASNLTVDVGQTLPIAYTLTPSNATEKPVWTSANAARATVDEFGNVTGVSVGETTVTGKLANNVSATITVTVIQSASDFTFAASNMTVQVNQTLPIQYTVSPANATEKPTWESGNNMIATVDADGNVTGKMVGTVSVTGRLLNGTARTIQVNVIAEVIPATGISINGNSITMFVGDEVQIDYTVTPANTTERPTWTSAASSIASVNANGVVKGEALGITTVTGRIVAGPYANITVNVVQDNVLPVNAGPFSPYRDPEDDYLSDGFYEKFNYGDPTNPNTNVNELYHYGSIHLEEIIADGNLNGITAAAADSKYASFITVGNDFNHGQPSIIFSYRPTNAEVRAWMATGPGPNAYFSMPIQVVLTRGTQTATVTINMDYYSCLWTTVATP